MRTLIAMMTVTVASASLIQPGSTQAVDLGKFLAEVEEAGRFQTPVRADLRVQVKEKGSERHYDGVAAYSGTDVYIELREPPLRVLIRTGDGGAETVHVMLGEGTGQPASAATYDVMGETTLIPDDFRSFRAGALRAPQIVSETKRTLLVSGAPAEASPYVLLACLFDRAKRLPTRKQYYERTLSNLVRMRRDTETVRIADMWRPGRTEIEDYRTGAVTTIERRWTVGTDLPTDLFDPKTLATRSLLAPAGP